MLIEGKAASEKACSENNDVRSDATSPGDNSLNDDKPSQVAADLLRKIHESESTVLSDDESDDSSEEQVKENVAKRQKRNDDQKLLVRRVRNREYSRCTRERKKAQTDLLQLRAEELTNEKIRLELLVHGECTERTGGSVLDRIKSDVTNHLSDGEADVAVDAELLSKLKSQCSAEELNQIRRERNRVHAKKTRLKKRKMCSEMEKTIQSLEEDVRRLRAEREGSSSSSAESIQQATGLPQIGKFTGFRQLNNANPDAGTSSSYVAPDHNEDMIEEVGRNLAAHKADIRSDESNGGSGGRGSSAVGLATDNGTVRSLNTHGLNIQNSAAASIAAAAAHVAALTSAAASAGPMINIPAEFRHVPGVQEVVLEYEKKLLMEMQKKLLNHCFKIIAENIGQ